MEIVFDKFHSIHKRGAICERGMCGFIWGGSGDECAQSELCAYILVFQKPIILYS